MTRILVIDDDPGLLKMMKIMLDLEGFETILASSGRQGIQMAQDELPDLAIVDIMMPEISGYEVCKELRANPVTENIPLMILTARSQSVDRQMADDAGADKYITKPIMRDELIEHLNSLLRSGATNFPEPPPPPAPVAPPPPPPPERPPAPAPEEELSTEMADVAAAFAAQEGGQAQAGLPVVAILSLSEGAGATTVAVNMGLGAMQHGRACIVDLNDTAGQVAEHLRLLPPSATWLDLASAGPNPHPNFIGSSLMLHNSGVAIMAAPTTAAAKRVSFSEQALQHIFGILSEGFKRIIVDLPSQITPLSQTVLRMAMHVILIVSDDTAVLEAATGEMETLERLGLGNKLHVILNHSRPGGIPLLEAQQALDRRINWELSYEPKQTTAMAQGVPLVMSDPASNFSQSILSIARTL